ncbi:hypothetical protein VaNZ11_004164 [Volvox africanus]|uniref:HECT-type E3 ubiquitin transferase n=1 Tax=Volvox africanus TaxID=51714 RepID=A0ABQ5RX39_9CHLO|nr:hypothetical protein VaNZ11_004164 [Volvox africanus]
MQLLTCSVQLGVSHISLVAWPDLPVQGLVQRFLSNCGLDIDPDAVGLQLDRYLLPPTSRLGAVIARWHRPVGVQDVVRLKALFPRHLSGKARIKLEARGPPLHTVRQVTGRAMAAMAMQAGTTRLQSIISAAADVSLLPCTFTNWTDAWEHSLMKAAVSLVRALMPYKPAIAGSVVKACSDLLDLPTSFAPGGELYQGLCALQLHIALLQAVEELKANGWIGRETGLPDHTRPAPATAATNGNPAAAAAEVSTCQISQRAGSSVRVDRAARGPRCSSGSGSGTSGRTGGGGRGSGTVSQAREARQRESMFEALQQLLAKAAERVGVVLEQLSYYGSKLSNMLDEYSRLPPAQGMGPSASSGCSSSGNGRGGAAAAAAIGGRVTPPGSPSAARDLRFQVIEVLEPYAAMQLLEAFGRMAMVGYPRGTTPSLCIVPSGWNCHRSLFHAILDLGSQAGILARTEGRSDGGGADMEESLPPTRGSMARAAAGTTLELPLVISMLDLLLQLHVQAHSHCTSRGADSAVRNGGPTDAGGGGDDSDDGSSDEGARCCSCTPAICELPPCLDWLQDVTSVLEAACDVYMLVGGLDAEGEEEGGEVLPAGAASAPVSAPVDTAAVSDGGGLPAAMMTAAGMPRAAAAILPIGAMASQPPRAPPVGDVAIATAAAAELTRLDDAAAALPGPSGPARDLLESVSDGTASALTAAASPGPSTTTPPQQGSSARSSDEGGCDRYDSEPSDRCRDVGEHARNCMGHQPGDIAPSLEHLPPKTSFSDSCSAKEEATSTVPAAMAAIALQSAAASASAVLPIVAVAASTAAGSAQKVGAAVAPPGPTSAAESGGATIAASGPASLALPAGGLVIIDSLYRAFQCPCLVAQLLEGGSRAGELCERAVWRHPRLAGCAPAAAYYKQALDNLLKPLSYVYDEDDYDAPVIYVDRSDMLGTSFASLMDVEGFLEHEGICIKFEDEEAYGDGVLREWLTEIAALLFDPNAGLFRLCEGDARALHVSPAGSQQEDQLELLRFAGRILGLAMRARVPLGVHLSTALFKLLQHPGEAGRDRLGMADLAQLEPRLATTCRQIAAAKDVEALGLTFVASCGHLGLAHEVPLLPGYAGEDVAVTAANRRDYLDRLVKFYCTWGCSSKHGGLLVDGGAEGGEEGRGGWDDHKLDAVAALAQGLAEALFRIPDSDEDDRVELLATRLRSISAAAFNSRLGGEVGGIDVDAWRSHTSAPAFKSDGEQAVLKAFWSVVSELSADDQRRLLQFWTGISHLPAGGFKHLSQQLQLVPSRPADDSVVREAAAFAAASPAVAAGLELGTGTPRPSASDDGGNSSSVLVGDGPVASPTSDGASRGDIDLGANFSGGTEPVEMASGSNSRSSSGGDASGSASGNSSNVGGEDGQNGSSGSGRGSGSGSGSRSPGDAEGERSRFSSGGRDDDSGSSDGVMTLGVDPDAASSWEQPGTGGRVSSSGAGGVAGPLLLTAHTCFFQLRLPLLIDKAAMKEAVVESLANLGAFWNE